MFVPDEPFQHSVIFVGEAVSLSEWSISQGRHETQDNDIQHNNTAIMLNVAIYYCYAECHYAQCRGAISSAPLSRKYRTRLGQTL